MAEPARHGIPEPSGSLLPWSPVLVGIGAVVGLLVTAFALPLNFSSVPAASDRPGVTVPTGAPTGAPAGDGPSQAPPTPSPPPSPSPAPADPAAPDPEVRVSGTFRVVEAFEDTFIGEVRIDNRSSDRQEWIVMIQFPDTVGELDEFWVESAPQATLDRSGDAYVFRGSEPVPARSSAELRFKFVRTGDVIIPELCETNGERCTVKS